MVCDGPRTRSGAAAASARGVEASMNLMARNKMRLYDLPSKLPCDPVVCSTSSSRFLFLLQRGAGELFPQPLTGRYVRGTNATPLFFSIKCHFYFVKCKLIMAFVC